MAGQDQTIAALEDRLEAVNDNQIPQFQNHEISNKQEGVTSSQMKGHTE